MAPPRRGLRPLDPHHCHQKSFLSHKLAPTDLLPHQLEPKEAYIWAMYRLQLLVSLQLKDQRLKLDSSLTVPSLAPRANFLARVCAATQTKHGGLLDLLEEYGRPRELFGRSQALALEGSLAQSCSTSHCQQCYVSVVQTLDIRLLTRIHFVLFSNKGRDYRAWVRAKGVECVWLLF